MENETMTKEQASKVLYIKQFEENEKTAVVVLKKVNAGKALLIRNVITNKYSLKKAGVRAVFPILDKIREVDLRILYSDWPKFVFYDKNNIPVYVDIVVGTQIQGNTDKELLDNVIKAKDKVENIFDHIYFKIRNSLTPLFKKLSYEEIAAIVFEEDAEQAEIKQLFKDFKEITVDYGMTIESFVKKSVETTKEIQDAYSAKEITDRKNKAILESAKAKVEVTKREVESKKLLADANAYADRAKGKVENEIRADLIKKLLKYGVISEKDALELLKVMALSASDKARVTAIVGDGSNLVTTAASIGSVLNQVKQGQADAPEKILK